MMITVICVFHLAGQLRQISIDFTHASVSDWLRVVETKTFPEGQVCEQLVSRVTDPDETRVTK